MQEKLQELIEFTKECRDDMHEPDEQGIKARVVGDHLDNACGESVTADAVVRNYQEYVVVLDKGGDSFKINLATLIAIARKSILI